VNAFLTQRSIRHRTGDVIALAKVEDMRAIEIMQAEVFGKGTQIIRNVALDTVRNIVDEVEEGVARGFGGVEEGFADAGGVKLRMPSMAASYADSVFRLTVTTA